LPFGNQRPGHGDSSEALIATTTHGASASRTSEYGRSRTLWRFTAGARHSIWHKPPAIKGFRRLKKT
jgi:hypothetical protein